MDYLTVKIILAMDYLRSSKNNIYLDQSSAHVPWEGAVNKET